MSCFAAMSWFTASLRCCQSSLSMGSIDSALCPAGVVADAAEDEDEGEGIVWVADVAGCRSMASAIPSSSMVISMVSSLRPLPSPF